TCRPSSASASGNPATRPLSPAGERVGRGVRAPSDRHAARPLAAAPAAEQQAPANAVAVDETPARLLAFEAFGHVRIPRMPGLSAICRYSQGPKSLPLKDTRPVDLGFDLPLGLLLELLELLQFRLVLRTEQVLPHAPRVDRQQDRVHRRDRRRASGQARDDPRYRNRAEQHKAPAGGLAAEIG